VGLGAAAATGTERMRFCLNLSDDQSVGRPPGKHRAERNASSWACLGATLRLSARAPVEFDKNASKQAGTRASIPCKCPITSLYVCAPSAERSERNLSVPTLNDGVVFGQRRQENAGRDEPVFFFPISLPTD